MTTNGQLEGRVAIVTGGARGQGAAEARRFAAEGARVVIADTRVEGADTAAAIGAAFLPLDVTDEAGWRRVVDETTGRYGRLDVLVNNAGVLRHRRIEEERLEDFARILEVNLHGAFLGIRTVAPAIRAAGGGAIVNVSSTAGQTGYPGLAAYGASKWALRGLTRTAAVELADAGIRVNCVMPGGVDTPMARAVNPGGTELDHGAAVLRRLARPEEIAEAVLYLASDASSYVTGTDLLVDGGLVVGGGG